MGFGWDDQKYEKFWPADLQVIGKGIIRFHAIYWPAFLLSARLNLPKKLLVHEYFTVNGQKMSKTLGNVYDPIPLVEKYGADSLRLCILFAAPPEDQLEWSNGAVEGAWKFLNRIYHIIEDRCDENFSGKLNTNNFDKEDRELNRQMHVAIKKVTEDFSHYKFNTAISALMILLNHADKYKYAPQNQALINELCRNIVLLLAPITPHVCEELWQTKKMGVQGESIIKAPWPQYDEAALQQEVIRIIAQVNGKLRGRFHVPAKITEGELKETILADPKIREFVGGRSVKKFIYIPQKLVNLVV